MKQCIDCGKKLGKRAEYYRTVRCSSCAAKVRIQKYDNPNLRHGGFCKDKKYYCIDCKKEVSPHSVLYGKGRCFSCANKGDKNPAFNPNKSEKLLHCIDCTIELNRNAKYQNQIRCKKCWHIFAVGKNAPGFGKHNLAGKNHWNYINGKGNFPYPLKFNDTLKEQIRKRDNYECQNCSMTEEEHLIVEGRNLGIHHIDYNKENCNKENLITLCNQCNVRANYNRSYWKDFYKNKIIILTENGGIIKNG
jgi:DNA-directed RNA polymerase subunit RPC12/RpoP